MKEKISQEDIDQIVALVERKLQEKNQERAQIMYEVQEKYPILRIKSFKLYTITDFMHDIGYSPANKGMQVYNNLRQGQLINKVHSYKEFVKRLGL